jgi:hypothetical protein
MDGGRRQRPARYMSTPMIKGELAALLQELVPDKHWSSRTRVTDLCEFALATFPADTSDPRQARALELAHVLYDHERR